MQSVETNIVTNLVEQTKNWVLYPSAPNSFLEQGNELLMQVLYNRGLRNADEVQRFLVGSDAVREDPYRLRDMAPAVTRILHAIRKQEVVCIYGDFDADGVTATALLVTALQSAGARVGPYIPDRVDEGYGLNLESVERIAQKAQLLITVDCGIRSVLEVERAILLGMDVIVTDHHSVGSELPPALAVINPRRADCTSRYEYLAGVGVAYRLAQGVLRASVHQKFMDEEEAELVEQALLDYVAIGTVADIMPLKEDNRSLVQRGLAQLNRSERAGLRALINGVNMRMGSLDATAIAFRIAPRINAAGRLSQTMLAYDLLRTSDPTKASTLAAQLETLNQQRRTMTDQAQKKAEKLLAAQKQPIEHLAIVSSPEFQSGIVGLVAGKLKENYYLPALVIEEGEQESRGSARSIPELDISSALDDVEELLLRHGGHSRAAGFTVLTKRLPDFEEALRSVAEERLKSYKDLRPTLEIDVEVHFDQLTWALQEQFARLEPTGNENPTPLLLCRNCSVQEKRLVGDKRHLRLILDDGARSQVLDAVAFHQGHWAKELTEGSRIDIVFHLEINEWMGRQRLQLNIQDLRPTDAF